LELAGEGYAPFKRDLLPASPLSPANDVLFPRNNASLHFSGFDALALLRRQEECPVGYPIQCENLRCCLPEQIAYNGGYCMTQPQLDVEGYKLMHLFDSKAAMRVQNVALRLVTARAFQLRPALAPKLQSRAVKLLFLHLLLRHLHL
jgi:hypothetical protein